MVSAAGFVLWLCQPRNVEFPRLHALHGLTYLSLNLGGS